MTTDAAFKKQVRELAQREGIPYAEARTRLLAASPEDQKTADHRPSSDPTVAVEAVLRHEYADDDAINEAMGSGEFDSATVRRLMREAISAASPEEQKTADHLPIPDVAVGDRALDLADDEPDDGLLTIRYVIQQTINDPMASRPYPWYLDEEGNVGHQSLWNGDPSSVIGFQSGEEQRVVLLWSDFVKDPQSALGLVPVMVDDNGGFAAWRGETTSVDVRDDDHMRA